MSKNEVSASTDIKFHPTPYELTSRRQQSVLMELEDPQDKLKWQANYGECGILGYSGLDQIWDQIKDDPNLR